MNNTSNNQIKLSEYAKKKKITYRTAWKRFKMNEIPNAYKDETGHVYIKEEVNSENNCIIYARVSSHDRKNSLKEQQARLENYAKLNNFNIIKSYKEIASGMNDNRPILNKILNDDSWDILLIENKDRLTRFGFNYIEQLCSKMRKKILVINTSDNDKEDLMKDLISVIYSFSARMYGLRRKKNKEQIIKFLKQE